MHPVPVLALTEPRGLPSGRVALTCVNAIDNHLVILWQRRRYSVVTIGSRIRLLATLEVAIAVELVELNADLA
jgi:hypothetical protein